ncbi:hypothetical protein D3093_11650 [Azospirillum argentinense]|uniref:Uncharacterized protein n=1 Tax=Azospirillum argentinense TaxID=2970906 RepID=A0A4D8PF35_9PROT|nr:hypothetical protein [Azospirillum argentinense]QCN95860.1 hypothetical protein D3093_11650 [Azospirillum argentinense]
MFDTKTKAKQSAKSQLKLGKDWSKVVQLDDGTFDVITDDSDFEPCLEQVVGEWTLQGDEKVWTDNPNYDPDRVIE